MMEWTEERIAYLKERKDAGESAGVISKALGVSRSAIMGKSSRLGFGPWHSHKFAFAYEPRKPRAPRVPMIRIKNPVLKTKPTVAFRADKELTKPQLRRIFEEAWGNTAKLETVE